MARSFSGSGFSPTAYGSYGGYGGDEVDDDPRTGLVNLADVMLVFACGLMLALVAYWNLDLPNVTELNATDMQEVTDIEDVTNSLAGSGNGYMELGTVYQDPNTGKLYMITETGGENQPQSASSTDEAAEQAQSPSSS